MQPDTRRAVAYIAGRAISGKQSSAIYDFEESGYFNFSGTVSASEANVYDYDSSCHIGGKLASLYHYGHANHLQLELKGKQFSGFDYDEASHFNGTVNGSSVSLYDYASSQYHNYSL
jgi:hypothetical protein